MTKYNISITQEAQFAEVIDIIQQHKSHASQVVNNEILLTAWCVGKYVSEKLKTEECLTATLLILQMALL